MFKHWNILCGFVLISIGIQVTNTDLNSTNMAGLTNVDIFVIEKRHVIQI